MDDRRLRILEAENDTLRARIANLERELYSLDVALPLEWRLTESERRVFGVLLSRDLATKAAIMVGLYQGRDVDEAGIKIVDVFVCKMRKKLKPFKIDIQTVWGIGYSLPAAVRREYRPSRDRSLLVERPKVWHSRDATCFLSRTKLGRRR